MKTNVTTFNQDLTKKTKQIRIVERVGMSFSVSLKACAWGEKLLFRTILYIRYIIDDIF
jgi:hypothetical protein